MKAAKCSTGVTR